MITSLSSGRSEGQNDIFRVKTLRCGHVLSREYTITCFDSINAALLLMLLCSSLNTRATVCFSRICYPDFEPPAAGPPCAWTPLQGAQRPGHEGAGFAGRASPLAPSRPDLSSLRPCPHPSSAVDPPSASLSVASDIRLYMLWYL